MTQLRKALLVVIGSAVIAGAVGFFYSPWGDISSQRLLLCIAFFGCFGMLLGGIYAFDAESDLNIRASVIGRITIGSTASLILGLVWHWSLEFIVLASFIGAVLGYLGMSWAKYVEF